MIKGVSQLTPYCMSVTHSCKVKMELLIDYCDMCIVHKVIMYIISWLNFLTYIIKVIII